MSEAERKDVERMPITYRPAPDLHYAERKRRLREAYRWLLSTDEDRAVPTADEHT